MRNPGKPEMCYLAQGILSGKQPLDMKEETHKQIDEKDERWSGHI